MVDYGLFQFASAPRTGSTWFTGAMQIIGLRNAPMDVMETHAIFPEEAASVPRVTIVRHPCKWIASWHAYVFPSMLGVASDPLAEMGQKYKPGGFEGFMNLLLDFHPGVVGRVFDEYKADIYLRTDRVNEGCARMLMEVGLGEKADTVLAMEPFNVGIGESTVHWNPELRERFLDSEQAMLDRYGFEREP